MFCYQCGTQLEENSLFCHKCGAKMSDVDKEISDLMVTEQNQRSGISSEVLHQGENVMDDNTKSVNEAGHEESGFRDYINEHVRKTTEFETAEALLNSKVPLWFLKKCFGIPFIVLFVLVCIVRIADGEGIPIGDIIGIGVGSFTLALPLGYVISYLAALSISGRHSVKNSGRIYKNIDIDELCDFLNSHLSYLHPYFHEWGYLQQTALSMRSATEQLVTDSVRESLQQVRICTEFGEDQSRLAVIAIGLDAARPDSGQMLYSFSAENRIEGVPFLSHDWGFAKYKCQVRIIPILRAAMEYYLEVYKSE